MLYVVSMWGEDNTEFRDLYFGFTAALFDEE